jgi:molybdopterin-guanine dinucleotide biosynthesis protein A
VPSTSAEPFDAVVLAGARSQRLDGADKAMIEVGGQPLLERVLAGLHQASKVIVVGPQRPVQGQALWCEEQPPGGGPVAAFAAGLAGTSAGTVLLLAADLPFVAAAVPSLRSALCAGSDAALLVDPNGRINFLAGAWRRSSAVSRLARLGPPGGLSMRGLLDGLVVTHVNDPGSWGLDCDTWDAVERARALSTESKEHHARGQR